MLKCKIYVYTLELLKCGKRGLEMKNLQNYFQAPQIHQGPRFFPSLCSPSSYPLRTPRWLQWPQASHPHTATSKGEKRKFHLIWPFLEWIKPLSGVPQQTSPELHYVFMPKPIQVKKRMPVTGFLTNQDSPGSAEKPRLPRGPLTLEQNQSFVTRRKQRNLPLYLTLKCSFPSTWFPGGTHPSIQKLTHTFIISFAKEFLLWKPHQKHSPIPEQAPSSPGQSSACPRPAPPPRIESPLRGLTGTGRRG